MPTIVKPDYKWAMHGYLTAMYRQIQANLRDKEINATGYTSRSLEVDVYERGARGTLWADQNLYNTESGTPPKNRGGLVSFDDIREWMDAKNIAPSDAREANAMAGAITAKILAMGSITYRKGGRTDVFSDVVDGAAELDNFAEDAADVSADTVLEQLDLMPSIWKR